MTNAYPQEWLYRRIAEGVGDAFIFADREGCIRLWSPGAETMFALPREKALGRSLDLIIPGPLRERHWEGYRRVMATGETAYNTELLAVPAVTGDGRRISIEFSIALIRDDTGALLGAGAVIREVTERREKEKTLKTRLAELESRS